VRGVAKGLDVGVQQRPAGRQLGTEHSGHAERRRR
jgi:hypothetical protein